MKVGGKWIRRSSPISVVSLVPLIDVFMILLVFFLVTSTYLDLDALPAAQPSDEAADASDSLSGGAINILVLRLRADGMTVLRGSPLSGSALRDALSEWRRGQPDGSVLLIPSGGARMQDLARVMDALRAAQVSRVRLVRVEAAS